MHIYCWEQVILSRNGSEQVAFSPDVDAERLPRLVRDSLGEGELIVLTGLGCNEAAVATSLQLRLGDATFVYDVYDDLMFNAAGFERAERLLQDAIGVAAAPRRFYSMPH